MSETVGVVVATYGDLEEWRSLAHRALRSVYAQTLPVETAIHLHGRSLAHARNTGALHVLTDWLIFLDADDELDPGYVEAMLEGTGDIRQPMTIGVVDGVEDDFPVFIPPNPGGFMVGNHLVIGCMVRRDLFETAGGFDPGLPVLEDWDFWIRCQLAGGSVGQAPKAIYRVHVRPDSRNTEANGHHVFYAKIRQQYTNAWRAAGLP